MPFERFVPLLAVPASIEEMEPSHRLMLIALAAFSTVWVTALGAAIGSFLNVVVYRLPRGKSLLRPKSQCPACGTPIRPGDNIPVLGWLRLRGRCRACGGRISARYPLVEAATAVLFLGLAHFELFSGGANLPGGPDGVSRLGFILWRIEPALIGLFAYHAVLLAVLLCLSLIAWDGYPPPRRLLIAAFLAGLVAPIVLPSLHPVASGLPIDRLPSWTVPLGRFTLRIDAGAFVDAVAGLLIGSAIGLLLTGAVPSSRSAAADRRGVLAVAALIGTFLGWQAAISCGLLAALLALVNATASRLRMRSLPVTALVAATTLVQIPLWRFLVNRPWWPGSSGWNVLSSLGLPEAGFAVTSLTAAAIVTGLIALLARGIASGRLE